MVFVKVINICSPALFSVLCGRAKDFQQFQDYHKALKDYAIEELKCAAHRRHFQTGMTILAKCSTLEGKWAKGKLGEPLCSEAWEVVFDNYVITEVVKRSDVVLCPSELFEDTLPKIRFLTCSLEGIDKDDEEEGYPEWSQESLTYFRKCVKGEVLKLASMKQSGGTLFVNLLISRTEDDQTRSLTDVMREKGYLQPFRYSSPLRYLPQTNDLPETTMEVDGVRPKRMAVDDPSNDDDHVVEELCQLLKLTREEYYSLKEFESKPYEPKQYPPVAEMISEALSAGCNNSKTKASYQPAKGINRSRRGRGSTTFVGHFDQKDPQQIQRDENVNAGSLEKVISKGIEKVIPKGIEEIKGHCTGGCSGDKSEELIGHQKTTTPKKMETKNSNGLKDFLFKYVVEDKEKGLCLDFIGQIAVQNSQSHQTLKQGFWWIYEVIMETREVNERWAQNLSCFLADVYEASRSWPDRRLSENLLLGDFYSAFKQIVGKIEAAKETKIGHKILISFVANFLSKISNFDDNKGSVGHLFKSKFKDLVSSSRLERHVFNLFLTFLDPDAIYNGYYQAKQSNPEDSGSSYSNHGRFIRCNQDSSSSSSSHRHPVIPRLNNGRKGHQNGRRQTTHLVRTDRL